MVAALLLVALSVGLVVDTGSEARRPCWLASAPGQRNAKIGLMEVGRAGSQCLNACHRRQRVSDPTPCALRRRQGGLRTRVTRIISFPLPRQRITRIVDGDLARGTGGTALENPVAMFFEPPAVPQSTSDPRTALAETSPVEPPSVEPVQPEADAVQSRRSHVGVAASARRGRAASAAARRTNTPPPAHSGHRPGSMMIRVD